MKRNVYLKMMPLDQARERFLAAFDWAGLVGSEMVPSAEALGRITAQVVLANYSSPAYHAAAMDGIAVQASDTYGASEEHPRTLEVGSQATFVNTGQPLPPDANAVVMIEQVHQPSEGVVELRAAAFPWQHVRRVGEDMVTQELMFGHHHKLGPADVAALLTSGVFQVEVLQKPKVAIIPTGLELVDWREAQNGSLPAGSIMETNSLFLAGLVTQAGGEPMVMERVTDDFEAIKQAVSQALAGPAHMVLTNAGASAGSKDYSAHVINDLGEVLVHGVTVMPGKPSILGQAQGKPVVGTPGYPVSTWVCFDQFIAPALAAMQGQPAPERGSISVIPARGLASKLGREEFLRVHLGRVGSQVVATPLKRGAGAITSLTRADGLLRIPADSEGLDEGQPAVAELLGPRRRVEDTLVVVGSHDVTLDLLGDHMKRRDPALHLSSSHLGSLAGLMAIKQGRCHLGGTHLLDPATGEYNVSYIKRYLKEKPVTLVTLALRSQGLMVAPGNPKGVKGLADLAREDLRLVNRQAGSGTRVLMDYHLGRLGLDPGQIKGYDQEEYTHMAVAVQVLAGGADVGMGILAAANALGLDFIPVAQERYDLCIPSEFLSDRRVEALLEVLESGEFRQEVEALGGYDVSPMGTVAWESEG